jgi:uncharacterized protein DUF4184
VPLTPAHAAAALPLERVTRALGIALPMSALMIGTWTPDFEYVLLLRPGGKFGHTPLGLLVFCLPLGLLAWATFRAVVAPALLPLLPPGLETRVRTHLRARHERDGVAAAAAVLGSSLVGTIVLCAWGWWWVRRQAPGTLAYRGRSPAPAVRVAAGILGAAAVGAVLNGLRVHDPSLGSRLALGAVGAMAAFALAIVSYGVLARLRREAAWP